MWDSGTTYEIRWNGMRDSIVVTKSQNPSESNTLQCLAFDSVKSPGPLRLAYYILHLSVMNTYKDFTTILNFDL